MQARQRFALRRSTAQIVCVVSAPLLLGLAVVAWFQMFCTAPASDGLAGPANDPCRDAGLGSLAMLLGVAVLVWLVLAVVITGWAHRRDDDMDPRST